MADSWQIMTIKKKEKSVLLKRHSNYFLEKFKQRFEYSYFFQVFRFLFEILLVRL